VEPALRLRSLLEEGDAEGLARFVDKYLAGAGVGLHLWGDERVPRRTLVWNVVRSADSVGTEGEGWDRACLRVANVHTLIVKYASTMPVDGNWLAAFLAAHVKAAESGYAKARATKELAAISDSNLALLRLFSGKGDEGLGILEGLGDSLEITVKKAIVLEGMGRNEEALSIIAKLPPESVDRRVTALRLRLEGTA
ncbi:MAG: hypothetical protein LUO79_09025, partial [Methanomassiliicoccales archaeon]|nr:hypothetical protein [Methanomassiliicoccales archaeon]